LNRGIYKTVSTILTQVIVDPYDEAFYHPTKPIGRVMTKEEAEEEEKKGNHVREAAGGYRRIVAAPKPMDIVEIDAIRALCDADQVVIACGGGGIPVLAQNNKLQGASAVIEKDLAAGRLAELLEADMLVILTGTDKVCLNFGKEDEVKLDTLSVADAKKYLAAGEFGEGTMAPKIEAAIEFIGASAIRAALITKLNKEDGELMGGMGTLIKK
jgi:carbamate kinase